LDRRESQQERRFSANQVLIRVLRLPAASFPWHARLPFDRIVDVSAFRARSAMVSPETANLFAGDWAGEIIVYNGSTGDIHHPRLLSRTLPSDSG